MFKFENAGVAFQCKRIKTETFENDGVAAKSAVVPRNWATFTLLPRVVFHVRGLKRPQITIYLSPGMRILPGEPHQNCGFYPP